MRPVYPWRPRRIEAHIKLCVLGLLLERIAEIRGKDTWRNLVAKLDTVKVVEYTRGAVRVRQTTELRAEVSSLLKALGVPPPPRPRPSVSFRNWRGAAARSGPRDLREA